MASLTLQCLLAAAAAYQVSVPALQAIRTVEGGQERQEVCGNFDGSCDLGPFQVNDKAWVATLAASLGADRRVVRATLRDDGCWNAQVASWILRQELDDTNGDLREAIGNYHSRWRRPHDAYLRKIIPVLQVLSPQEAPPALPGAAPGDSPGALRIPSDVAGGKPAPRTDEQPKGKMIRVGKAPAAAPEDPAPDSGEAAEPAKPDDSLVPLAPDPDPSSSDKKPAPKPRPAPLPRIYRGSGGS